LVVEEDLMEVVACQKEEEEVVEVSSLAVEVIL
jgi:hypothetical protein